MNQSSGLPIDALLPQLAVTLRSQRNVVIEAPPGAGKSTVLPLALLLEPWASNKKLLLLEPRRIAARAVATRMASSLGERVGETIGYRMRDDTRVSARTRLEVVTEGVLTRMLQADPALEGVAAVLFDEYHERSLNADLGLALCLDTQRNLAESLRIIVMSATLDGAVVAALLGDAPVLRALGRTFEVEHRHIGRGAPLLPGGREHPEPLMTAALRRALDETSGDMLAFLPGAPEIRRVLSQLEQGALPRDVLLLPLYGELGMEAQAAGLAHAPAGRRKLILATNVAETSLTIEGLRVVVDSGLVRRSIFDPATGMSRLETQRISRASAQQRAGRAGRLASGICYRLWSADTQLRAFTPAEIVNTDLTPLALELARWGIQEPSRLRWLDAPPAAAFAQARDLLRRLGALDATGKLTSHGERMAAQPLHPRLAHMLLSAGDDHGLAAQLAALLGERDLMRGDAARDVDIRERLVLLRRGGNVDQAALQRARRQAKQLGAQELGGDDSEAGGLLALAFPDRIAQRREGAGGRFLLSNGRGATLALHDGLARTDYVVAVDLEDGASEARIRMAAPLTLAQVEERCATQITQGVESGWNSDQQALYARRVRRLDALLLEERSVPLDAQSAVPAVIHALASLGLDALPWDDDLRQLQARMVFVHGIAPEWPASDDATLVSTLDAWLSPWLDGITRRSHFGRIALRDALLGRLDYPQRRALDELAPTHFIAPTGSRLRIDYRDENAPCVEVRLQEVFGVQDTPRLGGGKVAVTFKLLSPARRPVQITRDLAGFWRGSYGEVRKDMRGRYPRHYWPEDPLVAEPTRGVRRR
ncbi:MAG: ATP-dependent helicase HrpB [Steroidobacteraceae bacterium]